jgi:nicotinate phosphoribosyltransferase
VPAIKLSENPDKIPNPGHKHIWRAYDRRGKANVDIIALDDEEPREMAEIVLRHPSDHATARTLAQAEVDHIEPLLETVWSDGRRLAEPPPLIEIRALRQQDISRLDVGVCRIMNPHIYHVSLTQKLWELKQELIRSYA